MLVDRRRGSGQALALLVLASASAIGSGTPAELPGGVARLSSAWPAPAGSGREGPVRVRREDGAPGAAAPTAAAGAAGVAATKPKPKPRQKKRKGKKDKSKRLLAECLDAHNKFRRQHNVPELEWDDKMAEFAQKRSTHIAASDGAEFGHPPDLPFGENLFWHSSSSTGCELMVRGWYDEINLYNYRAPSFAAATGHFTQLIWRSTKRVGCAFATSSGKRGGLYLTCNYDPPGNFLGEFDENVPRPMSAAAVPSSGRAVGVAHPTTTAPTTPQPPPTSTTTITTTTTTTTTTTQRPATAVAPGAGPEGSAAAASTNTAKPRDKKKRKKKKKKKGKKKKQHQEAAAAASDERNKDESGDANNNKKKRPKTPATAGAAATTKPQTPLS